MKGKKSDERVNVPVVLYGRRSRIPCHRFRVADVRPRGDCDTTGLLANTARLMPKLFEYCFMRALTGRFIDPPALASSWTMPQGVGGRGGP